MTAITAMMRRNSTSRRVQTFSSDSIRSDDIAATEMAWSRDASRDGVSDMRTAVHGLEWVSGMGACRPTHGQRLVAQGLGPWARQNQSDLLPVRARRDGSRAKC